MARWWWVYAALILVITTWSTPYDWYQIDGDAVGYMDISDYMLAHRWSLVVNGYWHPLYPAILALGQKIFHPTRLTELRAFYWMSDGIFLLEILSLLAFTDSLCRLRTRITGAASRFLLDGPVLGLFGLALLVIASQRELSPGKIRPDALLQAMLLFGVAALARFLATNRIRYAALMGLSLGLAYLTKSFALAFSFVCLAILVLAGLFLLRLPLRRIVLATVVGAACLAAVAGPYIAALSHQHHRLDMGDSGALNYAWFISDTEKLHLEPWMTGSFGAAAVHLVHPEQQLLADPPVYSFQNYPNGTYPPWFDPTYFNEHIVPRFSLLRAAPRMGRNVELTVRYLFDHLEGWILLAVLLLCGVSPRRGWRQQAFALPFLTIGVAVWLIYGLVNIEQRYVTVGFLLIIVALFAGLPGSPSDQEAGTAPRIGSHRTLAAALITALALLAAGESTRLTLTARRTQSLMAIPGGWFNQEIYEGARGLSELGLPPNAAIGCIGRQVCLIDTYLARVSNTHITSEIFVPGDVVQHFIAVQGPAKMALAEDAMRRDGAQIILAFFDLGYTAAPPPGWQRLGGSYYFYFDLRNPPPRSTPPGGSQPQNARDSNL